MVHLAEQRLDAYQDGVLFLSTLVSTGMTGWETPVGDCRVWARRAMAEMVGLGYDLPGVPWILYFNHDIAIKTLPGDCRLQAIAEWRSPFFVCQAAVHKNVTVSGFILAIRRPSCIWCKLIVSAVVPPT